MTAARSQLVDVHSLLLLHFPLRALLCGEGFEHREQWIEDRVQTLSECFAASVCGFAVMDNHLHVLVPLAPDAANGWSAEDVVQRWLVTNESRHQQISARDWLTPSFAGASFYGENAVLFLSRNGAVQDTAAQQRIMDHEKHEIHERCTGVSSYSRKTDDHWKTGSCAGARTHSPAMQSFLLSCVSCVSWFTSPTVDWAEAKLPWSQQEHLARQTATLALPTADHQRSHPLAGIEKDATIDEATHKGCEKIGTGTFANTN